MDHLPTWTFCYFQFELVLQLLPHAPYLTFMPGNCFLKVFHVPSYVSLSFLLCLPAASQLAFDQYGQLSEQLETESALRERAESVATQVSVTV